MSPVHIHKPINTQSTLHIMERTVINWVKLFLTRSMLAQSEIHIYIAELQKINAPVLEGWKPRPSIPSLMGPSTVIKTCQQAAAKSPSPAPHRNYIPDTQHCQHQLYRSALGIHFAKPQPKTGNGQRQISGAAHASTCNDCGSVLLSTDLI